MAVNPRKQRIVGIVTAAVLAPMIAAFFAYLFATGSPEAIPLLSLSVGVLMGYFAVYVAVLRAGRGASLAGRVVRGAALGAVCAAGFALSAALPFDGTAAELFLKGLAHGAGLVAFLSLFFGVLLPPNPSGWVK